MDKFNIEILEPAWSELYAIFELHMSLVGSVSAEQITNKILDSIELLEDNPQMGRIIDNIILKNDGYRNLICGNFICIYRIINNTVYIYHIVDRRTNYQKLLNIKI